MDAGEYHYICRPDGRCAPDSFVTVWMITDDSKTLKIPFNTNECKSVTVNWGDGASDTPSDCAALTHEYKQSGTYTVSIKGNYGPLTLPEAPDDDRIKLVEVKAFGPVGLADNAFLYCENLNKVSSIDIPDSTKLENLFSTFNKPLNIWDTSKVTTVYAMFQNAQSFNQDLSNWNINTTVTNIFDGSGLSQENYCKIQASESWTTKPSMPYTCP